MNIKFDNFNAFKPKIFNFKVPWLKVPLLEQLILCSKVSTSADRELESHRVQSGPSTYYAQKLEESRRCLWEGQTDNKIEIEV